MMTILVQTRSDTPAPQGRQAPRGRIEPGKSSLLRSDPHPPPNGVVSRADSQQLSQLFHQHGPRVYRRALRLLGNPADAEEATADVLDRLATTLSPRSCHAHLPDLPHDVEVLAVEPLRRRARRTHRFRNAA